MNWDKVRKEFETSDITMADLAKKHNVKPSTLRSRKNREDWQRNATGKATQQKKTLQRDAAEKNPKLVIENDNLTEQQKMFCLLYLQYKFNATKAYKEAYGVDYRTAHSSSYRLLANVGVNKEITRLKAELQQGIYVDVKDVLNEYVKQAFYDISDFVDFGTHEIPINNDFGEQETDDDGKPKTKMASYVHFKDADEVDGTLIQEVKMGKDGTSLKLMDKQKAMDALMKYIDFDALKIAQISKAQAEAKIAQNVADKLTSDERTDDLLRALINPQTVESDGDSDG